MTDYDRFIAWFNKNLKGETIYTADSATVRARLRQWDHLDGNNHDESLDLALDVFAARQLLGSPR